MLGRPRVDNNQAPWEAKGGNAYENSEKGLNGASDKGTRPWGLSMVGTKEIITSTSLFFPLDLLLVSPIGRT